VAGELTDVGGGLADVDGAASSAARFVSQDDKASIMLTTTERTAWLRYVNIDITSESSELALRRAPDALIHGSSPSSQLALGMMANLRSADGTPEKPSPYTPFCSSRPTLNTYKFTDIGGFRG